MYRIKCIDSIYIDSGLSDYGKSIRFYFQQISNGCGCLP